MAPCNTYSDEEEARVLQLQAEILEEIQQKKHHHVYAAALKRADSTSTNTNKSTRASASAMTCISINEDIDWTNMYASSVTDLSQSQTQTQTQTQSMSSSSDLYLEVPDVELDVIMREQQKILDQVKQRQQQQQQHQAIQSRLVASPVHAATATATAAVRNVSRAHLIETDTTSPSSRKRERPIQGYALPGILSITDDLQFEEQELLQVQHTLTYAALPSTPPRARTSQARSRDRHASHQEWQTKRDALAPDNQAVPCAPRDQDQDQDHRRLQVPGLAQALAAQSAALAAHNASLQRNNSTASSAPSIPRNNSNHLHEIDVDSIIIQRAAPPSSRVVRKLSSAASNTNMSAADNCLSPDYVVPEHPFVGAFHVSNASEPPSFIRQQLQQQQLSHEDQSTLTPDETTTTSHRHRQLQHPHHETDACQELAFSPLPATIVADTPIPTATEITALSPSSSPHDNHNNNNNNNAPNEGTAQGHNNNKTKAPPPAQKSTATYVFGGVLFAALLTGGAFLLLAKLFPQTIQIGIFDPAPTMPPTTLSSTIAPSSRPTQGPTLQPTPYVLDILSLPQYTVDSILQGGAHEKAYLWLLQDIAKNGPDRPEWKLQQRFALATLYYATNNPFSQEETGGTCNADDNGSTWQRDPGWLDFGLDECDWQVEEDMPVCSGDERIEALFLSSNCLVGYLPPEVSLLTHLKFLHLDNNFLEERKLSLPTELGLLVQLEQVRMANNNAKGVIPSEFGKLTNLQALDLGVNDFDQQMPTELGLMGALQELTVRANNLQGTLPAEIVRLLQGNLRTLNVEQNSMEGTLPDQEFNNAVQYLRDNDQESYRNLKITLDWNRFTGTVPSELCSLRYQNQFSFSCTSDGLCGCACDEQCPAT